MSSTNELTVSVFYYDTEVAPSNQPREIAKHCCAEIVMLCSQLLAIGELLDRALIQREIEDVVSLCHLHYENLLFRIYALRERAWDALAALTAIPRRSTSYDKFRNDVLSSVQATYPDLVRAFHGILSQIDSDVKLRNVATHKTILMLGLTRNDSQDIWEFDSVLSTFDPDSEESRRLQKSVRKSLRAFVTEEKQHIRDIHDLALEFAKQCDTAIRQKHW